MAAPNAIRILCVEDHPVFREGLRAMIEAEPDMTLVGHAPNAVEAIAQFRRHRPDVTLMDLRLPGANGTDVLISIRGEFPQARIIMLTTSDGDADIQRAMRAGASRLHTEEHADWTSCWASSGQFTLAGGTFPRKWRPDSSSTWAKTISLPAN